MGCHDLAEPLECAGIVWDTTRKEAEKNVQKENIMEFH